MQTVTPTISRLGLPDLRLGEGPYWHIGEQALYFVDIRDAKLYRFDPSTGQHESWRMPSAIGSCGMCVDGRAIVALQDGVYFFDFATHRLTLIVDPEPGVTTNRLNDGKVGPDGRFWVGSMDDRLEKEATGGLYRIDWDGTCTRMRDGLSVSNGLAWSPDGRTMYHSDSRDTFIEAFDYDLERGDISNRRVIRQMTNEEGRPDGAAVDAEGCYWSAGVSAGCLNRLSPDGVLLTRINLPLAAPTMPCFGGPDLKTLYVTSLQSDRLGPIQPGTMISFPVDVPGIPVGLFGARLPGL
jgi:sugar lactone lactonase YvrE